MMSSQPYSFAGQRIICLALVLGMTMYAIVAGVVLQSNDGAGLLEEPLEGLDSTVLIVGGVTTAISLVVRLAANKLAEARD